MDTRQAIYNRRILANASLRYFEDLSDIYRLAARAVELSGFLLASAAAISVQQLAPKWTIAFSTAAALVAGAQLVLRFQDTAALCALAAKHWTRRWHLWDVLWLKVANAPDRIDEDQYALELERDSDFEEPPTWYWRFLSVRAQKQAALALTEHAQDQPTAHQAGRRLPGESS